MGAAEAEDTAPKTPPLPNFATGLKGILFDVDGTVVDSDPLHFKAFQLKLDEHGFKGFENGQPINREYYDEHISGGHNSLLGKVLFPDWTAERQDAFMDEKEQQFRKLAGAGLERLPGLTEFLAWMDEHGIRRVAVTNAPKANAKAMLTGIKLTDAFEKLILGEECERPKPYPDPYLEGLRVLGCEKHEALILEDSVSGVKAGVAAGIPTVGVLTSQTPERMLRAGCVASVRDYWELLERAKRDAGQAGGS